MKSIALCFYTLQRPAAEIAGKHSTGYVRRPLPARFRAGVTLSPDDVSEIEAMLTDRDAHIADQYAESYFFNSICSPDRSASSARPTCLPRTFIRTPFPLRRSATLLPPAIANPACAAV